MTPGDSARCSRSGAQYKQFRPIGIPNNPQQDFLSLYGLHIAGQYGMFRQRPTTLREAPIMQREANLQTIAQAEPLTRF